MPTSALALPLHDRTSGASGDALGDVRETRGASLRLANERGPGGPTLDALLTRLWEGLVADRKVSCPWCAGSMAPRHGAGVRVVAGRCGDCGSELS